MVHVFWRATTGLALMAAAVVLSSCAVDRATGEAAAMIQDARRCEADATRQLGEHGDPTLRRLVIESCMALNGWNDR